MPTLFRAARPSVPLLIWVLTILTPVATPADDQTPQVAASAEAFTEDPGCAALAEQLTKQNQALSRELRTIKRDLAMLNQNLEKPGLRDAMAGIGYILGLFGIAAFMAARRGRPQGGR